MANKQQQDSDAYALSEAAFPSLLNAHPGQDGINSKFILTALSVLTDLERNGGYDKIEMPNDLFQRFRDNLERQEFDEIETRLISMALAQYIVRSKELFNTHNLGDDDNRHDDDKTWDQMILVITGVEDGVVRLRTMRSYTPFIAVSHRWKEATEQNRVKVEVENAGAIVATWETDIDVDALEAAQIFSSYADVWLDLLCIRQDSSQHKSAQVAIMGLIFASSLTVILDERYQIQAPSHAYFERTWTFQEYAYGAVLPLWLANSDNILQSLVDANVPLDFFGNLVVGMERPLTAKDWLRHDYRESWREKAMQENAQRNYGKWHEHLYNLFWYSMNGANEQWHQLLTNERMRRTILLAAMISRFYFGSTEERFYYQNLVRMREKKCAFPKDRMFGIWGVTCQVVAGVQLDYSKPAESLEMIRKLCKAQNIAFFRDDDMFCSDKCALPLLEQITAIPPGNEYYDECNLKCSPMARTNPSSVKAYKVPFPDVRRGFGDIVRGTLYHDESTGNCRFSLSFPGTDIPDQPAFLTVMDNGRFPNFEEFSNPFTTISVVIKAAPAWQFPFNLAHDLIEALKSLDNGTLQLA